MQAQRDDDRPSPELPVMRPRLPTAAQILPYLELIDATRWYSNFGPLSRRFEAAMARHFATPDGTVAAVANGTTGLVLALHASGVKAGSVCMVPAFTFSASPAAVLAAGLVPWFVDVDPETWALEPAAALSYLGKAPGPVGAVMPVSVFGRPVDAGGWDDFAERTGIPAIIDGAASFDRAGVGRSPTMISLHATKIFGVGEGGLILSRDQELIGRIHSLSNFGFPLDVSRRVTAREAHFTGFNGKFSEYQAAVGLAGLDLWEETRAAYRRVKADYLDLLAGVTGLSPQPGGHEDWCAATVNFELPDGGARDIVASLDARGVQARRWWGDGCHREPAYAAYAHGDLPVTERLSDAVIGLPCSPDMTRSDIQSLKRLLAGILA